MNKQNTINLDPDQNKAYIENQNVTVSAGAGSGKTTVLAERYVRLVTEENLNINEVLTLTFTRKASAEMYERIFKRLSKSNDSKAKERLTQFDQARIATLDSFCISITKGAVYRYGISGDFRIDDNELRRIAEESAIEIIMTHKKDQAICRLVSARSFDAVVKDLFADLAIEIFSFVKLWNFTSLAKDQIAFLKKEKEKYCDEITRLCNAITAIDDRKTKSDTMIQVQKMANYYLSSVDREDNNALLKAVEDFMDTKKFPKPRSNAKDNALKELREMVLPLKDETAPRLLQILKTLFLEDDILSIGLILDEYEKLFLDRKRSKSLLSFRDTAELAVDILKKDIELRGYYKKHIKAIMIDEFQDNNKLQKDLLYLLSEKDECGAADLIPNAKDLAPNKLFFVGDEKQSIYRFRGADVSVFRSLAKELSIERDANISLNTNYRSVPELVDFFNALFPGVFGKAEELFEAEFSPMRSSPNKERKPENASAVVELFIQEIEKTKDDNEDEERGEDASKESGEALVTAKRIIAGVENGEFKFEDVAVLFKSTTHQSEYERTFRLCGIPFSAADPRGLFSEGPANDFYAILRLCLFPLDRNAYSTVLRSPFVKLGDETIFRIMLEKPDEPFPEKPEEHWFSHQTERQRYENGVKLFNELKNRIDMHSIASVLAYLWYETSYRTFLSYDKKSRPTIEHFEYLYTLALSADDRRLNTSAFLDELAPRMGTTDKTETGDIPDTKGEVLFLTVHKSKGLEFPVVILANAGSSDRGVRNDKPYFLDPEYGPVINLKMDTAKRDEKALNYFYSLRQEFYQNQEEAELKRLFYVAVTRAKEKLIMVASRSITKDDVEHLIDLEGDERLRALVERGHRTTEGKILTRSFLDLFSCGMERAESIPQYTITAINLPTIDDYYDEIRTLRERIVPLLKQENTTSLILSPEEFYAMPSSQEVSQGTVFTSPTQLEIFRNLLNEKSVPIKTLPVFKSDPFLEVSEIEEAETAYDVNENSLDVVSFTTEEMRMRFGTLCHRMIEKFIVEKSIEKEVLQEYAKECSRSLFFGAKVSNEALHTFAEESLECGQMFFNSELGQKAYSSKRLKAEFPFILPVTNSENKNKPALIRGNMDLIFEHNGECIIIDFKTDRLLRPETHRIQLSSYYFAAKAFSHLPVKTFLVYLRNMQAVPFNASITKEKLFNLACKMSV